MTKKYLYRGCMTAETIEKKDYVFVNGSEYELPENNARVKQMERQGRLTVVPEVKKKGTK